MTAADTTMAATSTSQPSEKKEKIVKQAAIHNASLMASATKRATPSATPSAFAQISRAVIELEIMALQARLVVLDELSQMSDEEKMDCLFTVLDKNRDGSLSVTELADGLRKVRGDVNFEESLAMAMERVAYFDTDGDAKLQPEEFAEYVMKLCEAFGATFHDLAEMLILSVVFSEGNDDVDNMFAAIAEEEITLALKEEEALAKVMNDDRMKVLFHMFDLDSDGSVDLIEVVNGLYKITEDLDEAAGTAIAALMMFDEEGNAEFSYEEFTRFVLQLISATGQTFDEAIYSMTKAAAEDTDMTKEELLEKIRALAGGEEN